MNFKGVPGPLWNFSRQKTELCHWAILLQQYSQKLEAFDKHHRSLKKTQTNKKKSHHAQRQEAAFAFRQQMHDIPHNQQ